MGIAKHRLSTPGSTHSATVTANASSTLRSPIVIVPELSQLVRDGVDAPSPRAECRAAGTRNHTTTKAHRDDDDGHADEHPPANVTLMPAVVRSRPTPMRFGGVPTGVPMPPIVAANDVTSIIAIA